LITLSMFLLNHISTLRDGLASVDCKPQPSSSGVKGRNSRMVVVRWTSSSP
jgi:hypothetical protein